MLIWRIKGLMAAASKARIPPTRKGPSVLNLASK